MKLVAAKCPSCGANIDVDANSDSTKCDFCNSKIIVDDAIQKLRIELSGKVEVENLPTVEKLMKNADRFYSNQDYSSAFEKYNKVLDLEPENVVALFRRGIAGSLMTNYNNLDLDCLVNGISDCSELVDYNDKKMANMFLKESFYASKNLLNIITEYCQIRSYSINLNRMEKPELELNRTRLNQIKNILEFVINNSFEHELDIDFIEDAVKTYCDVINYLMNLRYFVVYNNMSEKYMSRQLILPIGLINELNTSKNNYILKYNNMVPENKQMHIYNLKPNFSWGKVLGYVAIVIVAFIIFISFVASLA